MSDENLVEARAKRAEKDAAEEARGKEKRGRKRRSSALEASTPMPETKGARMTEVEHAIVLATPCRAPVARMH